MFTPCQIVSPGVAQSLYRKLCCPSKVNFYGYLTNNRMHNCPIIAKGAKHALTIYGANMAVAIPPLILEHYRHVALCVDFYLYKGCISSTPSRATLGHIIALYAAR